MKKIAVLVLIVLVAILSVPVFYTKQLSNVLQKQKLFLQSKGIDIEVIKNNDSFFKVDREFLISIKDVKKALSQFDFMDSIDYRAYKDIEDILYDAKFLVKLRLIKYPFAQSKVAVISIYSLRKELVEFLKASGNDALSFFKNDLKLFVDIDAKMKVRKVGLFDIARNDFVLKNIYLNIEDENVVFNLDKFRFKFREVGRKTHKVYEVFRYKIDNIRYDVKAVDKLNYKGYLKTDNFLISDNDLKIGIKGLNYSFDVKPILNSVTAKMFLNIDNILFAVDENDLNISTFKTKLSFDRIASLPLKDFLETLQANDSIKLQKSITSIFNQGFGFGFYTSIDGARMGSKKIDIDSFLLDINGKIKKHNQLSNKDVDTLKFLETHLHIKTTTHNMELLEALNPMFAIYIYSIAKKGNGNVVIDMDYKDKKLFSNGKQIF